MGTNDPVRHGRVSYQGNSGHLVATIFWVKDHVFILVTLLCPYYYIRVCVIHMVSFRQVEILRTEEILRDN